MPITDAFRLTAAALLLALPTSLEAQRMLNEPDHPLLRGFRFRAIGPVGQGGRVDDVAVDERNPSTWYIGFAVSGILKTTNNGTTFESIFDTYGSASIADLTLAPSDPNVIYVATGEANNRQTTSYGDGMYRSTDGGRTFTHIGLRNTQTLGRVVVHPRDPNTAWVAAGGHLYGPNEDRGVFMTTDGGRTWTKTLYVDEYTGAADLAVDLSNPSILWASMYQRQRTAWGFVGGGPGSGLHQSTDGGRTWRTVTGNGLPRGTMGRIGLDICRSRPSVIYAQIEVAADKEPAAAAAGRGGRGGGAPGGDPTRSGLWRTTDGGRSWTFMSNENQRPMYFSKVRVDPNNCDVVYLGGVGPTKSTDGGRTWAGLNNMGHVDNHAIWIDPANSQHVIYGNDGGVDVSYDGGDTWESLRPMPNVLAYHVSADMGRPYHVCTGLQDNGSWCGPSSVRNEELREGGMRAWWWTRTGGGDGFQNAIDPTDVNVFYTSSQNGNVIRYDLTTGESQGIRPNAGGAGRGGAASPSNILNPVPGATIAFNWNTPVRLSPHNPGTLYVGGRSLFISRNRGTSWTMTKELGKGIDLNARQIMGTPYSLPSCSGRGGGAGPGQPCIHSKGDGYGATEYGSMTEMAESPVLPGILWAGTDDGNVQVSRDGGATWDEVGRNIPGVDHETYVSGLEASRHDAASAYVALDAHRNNDLRPYVFRTTDYGRTWTSIAGDLPAFGNVNSIRQDPVNRNLLYVATELGFFVSFDEGAHWHRFMPNLGTGRVDEILVHPRDNDLILATHSRGIQIMDDITPLQRLTPELLQREAVLLPPREAVAWKSDRRMNPAITGDKVWRGENAPRGTAIAWHLRSGGGETVVTISDAVTGETVREQRTTSSAGLNRWQWNLCSTPVRPPSPPSDFRSGSITGGFSCEGGGRSASPGTYRAKVVVGGREIGSEVFRVLEDVWLNERAGR